jgi:hypothetical protein
LYLIPVSDMTSLAEPAAKAGAGGENEEDDKSTRPSSTEVARSRKEASLDGEEAASWCCGLPFCRAGRIGLFNMCKRVISER